MPGPTTPMWHNYSFMQISVYIPECHPLQRMPIAHKYSFMQISMCCHLVSRPISFISNLRRSILSTKPFHIATLYPGPISFISNLRRSVNQLVGGGESHPWGFVPGKRFNETLNLEISRYIKLRHPHHLFGTIFPVTVKSSRRGATGG